MINTMYRLQILVTKLLLSSLHTGCIFLIIFFNNYLHYYGEWKMGFNEELWRIYRYNLKKYLSYSNKFFIFISFSLKTKNWKTIFNDGLSKKILNLRGGQSDSEVRLSDYLINWTRIFESDNRIGLTPAKRIG